MQLNEKNAKGSSSWSLVSKAQEGAEDASLFVIEKTEDPTCTEEILARFSAPRAVQREYPEPKELLAYLDSLLYAAKNNLQLPNPPSAPVAAADIGEESAFLEAQPMREERLSETSVEHESTDVALGYREPSLTTFEYPAAQGATEEEKQAYEAAWRTYFQPHDGQAALETQAVAVPEEENALRVPPEASEAKLQEVAELAGQKEADAEYDGLRAEEIVDLMAPLAAGNTPTSGKEAELWSALLDAIGDNAEAESLAKKIQAVHGFSAPETPARAEKQTSGESAQEASPEEVVDQLSSEPPSEQAKEKVPSPEELLEQLGKMMSGT